MRSTLAALLSMLVLTGLATGTSAAGEEAVQERTQSTVPRLPATKAKQRVVGLPGEPGPAFAIHSTGTNQCLAGAESSVVLADCVYEPWQQWYFHDLGDSNYVVRNGDGGVLEGDLSTSCCNDATLRLSRYVPGNAGQEWLYWDDGTRHGFQNNYSYRNLAATDGAPRLWDYHRGDPAQLWWLELAE